MRVLGHPELLNKIQTQKIKLKKEEEGQRERKKTWGTEGSGNVGIKKRKEREGGKAGESKKVEGRRGEKKRNKGEGRKLLSAGWALEDAQWVATATCSALPISALLPSNTRAFILW